MKLYVWLFLLSSALSVALFVSSAHPGREDAPPTALNEEFDPSLYAKIQSVNDLLAYVDKTSKSHNRQSLAYAEHLSSTIRKRFFHNYAFYSPSENWAAWLAGKLVWSDLASIVVADDILKGTMAACSQQSLVLLACFQRLDVPFRAVRFAHHFATEAMFGRQWLYFDTDKEPHFPNGRKSVAALMQSGEFYTAYRGFSKAETDVWVGQGYPHYDVTSAMPAPRARLFQQATKLFSLFALPLLALYCLAQLVRLKARRTLPENIVRMREKLAANIPTNSPFEPATRFASWEGDNQERP